MPLSDFLRTSIIEMLFKQTSFVPPTTLFYSLHGSPPGDFGDGELGVFDVGYARAELDPDPDIFTNVDYSSIIPSPPGSMITNVEPIAWPKSGGPWNGGSPIPYWGLWSQLVGGDFYMWGTISSPLPEITSAGRVFSASPGMLLINVGVC